ncbi:DUF72 domain-containing protein [Thermodesulfobacteriota bacterium]
MVDARELVEAFFFRDVHSRVFMGTASDRYAGWVGQIYTPDCYSGRISGRTKALAGSTFEEQVLPVASVREYFEHFAVLELDFTFYRPLLDARLKPTANYYVLRTYRKNMAPESRVLVKVPQVVFARKLWRDGEFVSNADYLNHELFAHRFYEPAVEILGNMLAGFVFEQEYQTKRDKVSPREHAASLDSFFERLPPDDRYHCEIRTQNLLTRDFFDVLRRRGVGQVLSHWTWLPGLWKQFQLGGKLFSNSGGQCVIRLMTPRGMRYEEAYEKAFPFAALRNDMLQPQMVSETVALMHEAVGRGVGINVIVNNRSGGNAPMIAREISRAFLTPAPRALGA